MVAKTFIRSLNRKPYAGSSSEFRRDGAGPHRGTRPDRPCDADRSILDQSTTYIRRVRHNPVFRSLASFLAMWLAICLAEPVQLHTCAMHGGLAIDVAMHDGGPHLAHHSTASIHSMAGHSHRDQAPGSQSNQCSCLGDCSGGKTPIFLTAAPTQFTSVSVEQSPAIFGYASPSVVSPRFLLPFSNGPPDALTRA
jgi:hypothetical protein